MNIIINGYTHTLTKNTPSEYSLVVPDVTLLTNPTYIVQKLDVTGTLSTVTTQVVEEGTYTIKLEEGLYLLQFLNYNTVGEVITRYYTILSSYQGVQECLLEIATNLLCTDLCNECYPNWTKDSVILLTADYFFRILNTYNGVIYNTTTNITSITQLPPSADVLDMLKLAARLGIYCDNCLELKTDCGC